MASTQEQLVEIFTGKVETVNAINTNGLHVTRLKALSTSRALIAIENHLYDVSIQYPPQPHIEKGRQGPFISRPNKLAKVSIVNKSNPLLSLPHAIQDINVTKTENETLIISCIDKHGHIKVKHVQTQESVVEPPLKKRKLIMDQTENTDSSSVSSTYSTAMQHENGLNYLFAKPDKNRNTNISQQQNAGLCLSGFCGLDRNSNANQMDQFVSISSHYKLFNIGCRDKIVSNVYLSQTPQTCKYYSIPQGGNSSSVILVNEGNILSIWDERDVRKCVNRVDLRHEMYSIDINYKTSVNYIGCCGADKIVYVVDPFKWHIHSMWKSCAKYELLQCRFSCFEGSRGKYVYCVGMDHDLICGQWETSKFVDRGFVNKNTNNSRNKNQKKGEKIEKKKKAEQSKQGTEATANEKRFQHCFRGDAKWIGVDYVQHDKYESMIGVTNTGTVYVAHKPHLLNPDTHSV